jgi:alanine racemase
VLTVKPLLAGEGVSYGYTHRAPGDTRIALVTGGYAQGIVRALGNRVAVSVAGRRHRIVGRVAMDVCVIDIDSADVDRGADVLFLGDPSADEPGLGEWTAATGLTAGELVTVVGRRSERVYRP